ncbi:hypothetical protein L615_005100000270 [Nocardioides sp. J9]|uniref:hypothetical protein n=1 Tax=Nocardioides sp. J9 TaxID=935844 RepID=UPI0011A4E7FE|nr:hypothetical protein [Nocardioides sp. J9]TWG94933.1 hypothetical protein L615_005100000270 [Nocardioides sp. J9]
MTSTLPQAADQAADQAAHRVPPAPSSADDRGPVLRLSRDARLVYLVCAWCGPGVIAVAFAGWLISGVLPFPLGPDHTAAEVVAFYDNGLRVPMGIAVSSIGVSLVIPMLAALTHAMWRTERGVPILTLVQVFAGAVTAVMLLVPMLIMAVAGFRPERDAELTVLLNDLSWLLFITPIAPFIIQNLAIAAAAVRGDGTVLPRWLGYLNCWIGFTFSFDILAFVFHGGPFAWNGVLIFWLALTTYALWLLVTGLVLRSMALRVEIVTDEGVAA